MKVRPFQTLMHYPRRLDFNFAEELDDRVDTMTKGFEAGGHFDRQEDPGYMAIMNTLDQYKPARVQKAALSDSRESIQRSPADRTGDIYLHVSKSNGFLRRAK